MNSPFVRPIQVIALLMWCPVAAFAATLAVTGSNESPLNVPPVLLMACAFVATLAGATTLMMQMVKELKANADAGTPDKALQHPWANGIAHMLGSWLAAALFFFFSMAQGAGVWTLLAVVLVSAFGGATIVQRVADSWLLSRLPTPEQKS